jgi:hypothetical protein
MAAAAADLSLTDAQAKKLVNLAIEHGAYSDEMPDTKKGRIEAAVEAVEYCIDSWVNDGVRPDDEDEDIAAAGEAILTIFEAAGIEVDEDGDIQIAGEAEDDDEPEAAADDGEAPFDPDDYFEDGYTELTAASKLKALNELDLEDEDTVAIIVQIKDWEEEQEKPASRVLNWIEENIDLGDVEGSAEEDDDGEAEGEDDEDGAEDEEPWDGYDGSNAVDIKKFLDEAMESDDGLTVEQLQYVKEYEEARKAPRKRILDKVDELIAQIEEGDAEPEEEPKKKALGKKAPAKKASTKATKKAEPANNGAMMIVINEEEVAEVDAATLLEVVGRIAAEIEGGATTLTLDLG